MCPSSMWACSPAVTRSSCALESPTDSGVAAGRPCAEAGALNTTMASTRAVRRAQERQIKGCKRSVCLFMAWISWREERNRATE